MADDNANAAYFIFSELRGRRDWQPQTFNLGVGATGLPEYSQIIRAAVPGCFWPTNVILATYANDYMEVPAFNSNT